jgi:hypothetical protein
MPRELTFLVDEEQQAMVMGGNQGGLMRTGS